MPIVILVGLILGAGTMALSARIFAGLMGSVRQGQSREAQEAAEVGLAVIQSELNRSYAYLLISDCLVDPNTSQCSGWIPLGTGSGTWEPTTSKCPAAAQDPIGMQAKLKGTVQGGRSRYELLSYRFSGDKQQGGTGTFKIKAERFLSQGNSTPIRATAVIEQSVSILPKSCGFPVNSPAGQSGFPGLLGDTVNLGNNDITGSVNGNVMCRTCPPGTKPDLIDDVNLTKQGVISGTIFGGDIALPPPPSFPYPTAGFNRLTIDSNTTIVAGQSNGGACQVDSQGVTHCLINRINLTGGQSLCIYSKPGTYTNPCGPSGSSVSVASEASGGIRFYFDQTDAQAGGNVITVSGTSSVIHQGEPQNLGMFGLPRSSSSTPLQTVRIQGGSQSLGMFFFFPDASVAINGGASSPDVTGAIWARSYDGSNSNQVELSVPPNMGSLVWSRYGTEYGIGVREFAAIGTTGWRTFQLPVN